VEKQLASEVFRIFPEVRELSSKDDEGLPYVLMSNLVDFLEQQASPVLPAATMKRVLEFTAWCRAQPRGHDAENDILTILVVGLLEKIIESEKLRVLTPQLISKADLVESKEYLVTWVGRENYDRAMSLFPTARRRS
jgi:hypothetical protein